MGSANNDDGVMRGDHDPGKIRVNLAALSTSSALLHVPPTAGLLKFEPIKRGVATIHKVTSSIEQALIFRAYDGKG